MNDRKTSTGAFNLQRRLQVGDLTRFKTLALSRLAAQHAEIQRLRESLATPGVLRALIR